MTSIFARVAIVVLVLGCSGGPRPTSPPPTATTPATTASAASSSEIPKATVPEDPPKASEDAGRETTTKPPPVERTGKTWPFHAWDRAEAFTFNRFQMRPGAPFRIYDDNGWSKHIADRKPLDAAQAKQAVDLVLAGKSELEMTKCPFPRHAVVLYDHDVPVASVNVCFECGDILLWPRWGKTEVDWDTLTDAQKKKAFADLEADGARKQKLFGQVFPKWKTFFRDSVGYPVDEKWH
jgi:hypothetical protein